MTTATALSDSHFVGPDRSRRGYFNMNAMARMSFATKATGCSTNGSSHLRAAPSKIIAAKIAVSQRSNSRWLTLLHCRVDDFGLGTVEDGIVEADMVFDHPILLEKSYRSFPGFLPVLIYD